MKSIFFIEYKEDIPLLLKIEKSDQLIIIALDPEVAYHLEKLNIPYQTQDSYCSHDELLKAVLSNFEKVTEFCKISDKIISKNSQFVTVNNLTLTYNHFYCFKALFDLLSLRTYALKKIIETENPKKIYYTDNEAQDYIEERLIFKTKSSYTLTLNEICKKLNIKNIVLKSLNSEEQTFTPAITSNPVNKNLPVIIYRKIKKIIDKITGKFKKLPVVFVTFEGYNISKIIKIIKNQNFAKILKFDPESDAPPEFIYPSWEAKPEIVYDMSVTEKIDFLKIWNELSENENFKKSMDFNGISLYEMLKPRMKYFFTVFFPYWFRYFLSVLLFLMNINQKPF